jgi:hypothetical protein
VHQGLDDPQSPQLAARQHSHRAIQLQPQSLGDFVRVRRAATADRGADVDDVAGGQRAHRLQVLDQEADASLQAGRVVDRVQLQDPGRAGNGQLADDDTADRGLARTVRTSQHDDLAVAHDQIREPHPVRRQTRQRYCLVQPLHRAHHCLPSITSSLRRGL